MAVLQDNLPLTDRTTQAGQISWWGHIVWVLAAALFGWAVAAVFAGIFQLPRALFLVPYVGASCLFLYGYVRWSGIDIVELFRRHLIWGMIGALIVGAFVVWAVRNQPTSAHAQGLALAFDLMWLGVVYGLVDALLLSVLPIVATWQALSLLGWTERWPGRIAAGTLALVASLVVTAAYHLGYPEFRGSQLVSPLVGVGTMSLAALLANNPLAAVLSHIAMHIAAVLQGAESVVQLPPHY